MAKMYNPTSFLGAAMLIDRYSSQVGRLAKRTLFFLEAWWYWRSTNVSVVAIAALIYWPLVSALFVIFFHFFAKQCLIHVVIGLLSTSGASGILHSRIWSPQPPTLKSTKTGARRNLRVEEGFGAVGGFAGIFRVKNAPILRLLGG